jgi:hypothetical protein
MRAVEGVTTDGVAAVIHAEDLVLAVHEHAVDAVAEPAFAPRIKEVSVPVVDHDGMVSSAVEVYVQIGVRAHPGDVGVAKAGRQALPVFYQLESQPF